MAAVVVLSKNLCAAVAIACEAVYTGTKRKSSLCLSCVIYGFHKHEMSGFFMCVFV